MRDRISAYFVYDGTSTARGFSHEPQAKHRASVRWHEEAQVLGHVDESLRLLAVAL